MLIKSVERGDINTQREPGSTNRFGEFVDQFYENSFCGIPCGHYAITCMT